MIEEIEITPELLFETLATQISLATVERETLRTRLEINRSMALRQYQNNYVKVSVSVLKSLDRLIVRRSDRGIEADDAMELRATINDVIQLLQYE